MCLCHALTCLQYGISAGRLDWPETVSWLVILGNLLQLITSALIHAQNCGPVWQEWEKNVAHKEAKAGNPVSAIESFPTMYKHMNSLLLGTGRTEGQANSWHCNIIFVEQWSTYCLPEGSIEYTLAPVRLKVGCAQLVYLWMFGCKLLLVSSYLISWIRTNKYILA